MSKRLEGKKIVVTAAGQGIGKATAIAFHKEGANVTATDLNEKTLADLNKEFPNIKVKTLDSTNNNAILDFTKSLDKVDVLFNAVGFVHHGTILECEEKDWDFSTNHSPDPYTLLYGLQRTPDTKNTETKKKALKII